MSTGSTSTPGPRHASGSARGSRTSTTPAGSTACAGSSARWSSNGSTGPSRSCKKQRRNSPRYEGIDRFRPFLLCGSELEEFRNALGVLVVLEAGEQVVDELHAAG